MIKKILLGSDFSEKSKIAFKYALEFKEKYGASLTILSVNEDFLSKDEMVMSRVSVEEVKKKNEEIALNTKKIFKDTLRELNIDCTDDIDMVQREGMASDEILAYSEKNNFNLIIIGTSGHSAIEELFLGSTAKKIINTSKIPILVIPLSD